jgi:hypothetical protein
MTDADSAGGSGGAPASTAELIRTAADQVSRLVRAEMRLAGAELTAKARKAAVGTALLGAAGSIALYGAGLAFATLMLVLALVLPAWAAALIVTAFAFAVAALLGLLGARQLRRVGPPVPARTVDSIKADVQAVNDAVSRRGARR